ncbi:MAG TPA: Sua5/YciO/YrdC/YwlC family protein [Longimicrobiales bacterium]|nr:Sua5/YciO/YrdC/YwlC family protein [Longimicrobiales bacterium]
MNRILPFRTPADAAAAAAAVRAHLQAGGVLAYPTETVYGLGTRLEGSSLAALAESKGRDHAKSFLLLHVQPRRLPGLVWTPAAEALADAFWPGPLSIAVSAGPEYPPLVRSARGSVALRDSPLLPLRALLAALDAPLTSTSANRPGEPPATSLRELLGTLSRLAGGDAVLVLDGGTLPPSSPSTIVDCSEPRPRLLREGAIPLGELRRTLQQGGFILDVA